MNKFRVHFEASAAIGIEIVVEAQDEDDAEKIAQTQFDKGELKLTNVVDELIAPSPYAVKSYAEATNQPISFVSVGQSDETGFEIVDVFMKAEVP
ncbi:hypothetical protein JYP52_01195 [Nitratireductor aquibiodomus]|uniref:hypothetical protein n=1 Tax=Nitratireductor aquibiodomus TaxID=204799 RepID=UPI0019D40117|nr:hypothetical protein [Nitratireductor aquibiodomus]MBN7759737.1 hypothetical protein [Nitratireductor aquibiodomus]